MGEEKNYVMKKELSYDVTKYVDTVVMDILHFLNRKMNSNKEYEHSYSDLEYPHKTSFNELFDRDQYMFFDGPDYNTTLHLLDNNKLLLIQAEWPNYDDLRSYFWFSMYSNASDYILKTTKEDNGVIAIELDNGKGNVIKFTSSSTYYLETFPKEIPITNILRPITFEQLYERGHIKLQKNSKR